jgi:hypothetical protein
MRGGQDRRDGVAFDALQAREGLACGTTAKRLRDVEFTDRPARAMVTCREYDSTELTDVARPVTAHQLPHSSRLNSNREPGVVSQDVLNDDWDVLPSRVETRNVDDVLELSDELC